jgi:hypothetical protein
VEKKGVSTKSIEGIKDLYMDVMVGVKWAGNNILEESDSNIRLRQDCSISPTLFEIVINNVLRKLGEPNTYSPLLVNK